MRLQYLLLIAGFTLSLGTHAEATASYANDEKIDFSELIKTLPQIKTATVVFVPRFISFRTALKEDGLRYLGCTYFSQDKSQITDLINILTRSDLRTAPPLGWRFEKREGIFFTLMDGSEVKLLLGGEYSNSDTISGELTNPSIVNKLPVTANRSLVQNIYQWASRADVPADKLITNKSPRASCGSVMDDFKTP